MLPLARNGMRKDLPHKLDTGYQIVRTRTGRAERGKGDGTNDPTANAKRNSHMRMEAVFLKVFSVAYRFGRKIGGRILDYKNPARAEPGHEPSQSRRKRSQRRRLNPVNGRGRQHDQRAIVLEFGKSASVELQKLQQNNLREPHFGFNVLDWNI